MELSTVYKTLEFDKILEKASEYALLSKTKEAIRSLTHETTLHQVRQLLGFTEGAMELLVKAGSPPIYNFGEMEGILKRLSIGGSLSQKELLSFATLLKSARCLKEYFGENKTDAFSDYEFRLTLHKRLEDEIFMKIISEDEVSDNASDELYKIRRKKISSHNKIKETLQKYTNSPNFKKYLQNAAVTLRNDRFVLPVKQEFKGEIPGLIHDSSDSGATVFIEPMAIVTLNNELRELESKEKEEIAKILMELSGHAMGIREEAEQNYTLICELDFLFAKAKYSRTLKGEIPQLNEDGKVFFKQARHPLLNPETAVPIDIGLGDGCDTLVITGPNTGGKTVSLKTLGLLTLMAQSGFAIPVFSGSQVAVFRHIFADIGDEQSIEQSLSTFSSHMKKIVSILRDATFGSLALFDELGAGTDPTEGAALAIEIIEYLRKRGTTVAATTHYPELKLYALSQKGVQNASLEFSVETLMPTYRLIMGMPGKSNAFAISKRLGLSDEVLDAAEKRLSQDAIRFEDVLTVIDEQRLKAEKDQQEAELLKEKIHQLEQELSSKKEDALSKNREIIEKARREAVEIIDEAREKAEAIIQTLNEEAKNQRERAKAVGDARKKLAEERQNQAKRLQAEEKKKQNPLTAKELTIGMTVMMDDFDTPVTIDVLPDDKGNLTVLAGIMRIKTNLSRLSRCESHKQKPQRSAYRNASARDKDIRPELDLRGMNLEEAEYVTEKFIDDAVLANIPSVVIIHGKGTGVLRAGIHQLLKKNKSVKAFRLGTFGEGEAGVTICEMK
ncbi:MAG: endonuclease MutS2 [Clostridia bacterium]|nr:endonuclease MutS2 [Clostridia bacterium]